VTLASSCDCASVPRASGCCSSASRLGCYLVDLCAKPIDRLAPAERRRAHVAAEPVLRRTIEELRPETIVTMLKSIEPSVSRALAAALWRGERWTLPYPGRWHAHRELFVATLAPELPRLLSPRRPSG
jgi:hypothetical protein